MADLSKIKLNGTTYNFKDAEARSDLASKKIVTIQAIYTPQDESLNPDDIVTLTETYQDLGKYATQDEVIVLLQLKIQYDRTQETRVYLHSYTGGNTRSGYFYDLTNPLCYFHYASRGVSNLTDPVELTYIEDDMGYLTTETDPTVPAWAKASSKPTYTASEVGALSSSTTYVSSVNGNSGAVTLTASDVGALPDSTVIPKQVWSVGHGNYGSDYYWSLLVTQQDLLNIDNSPGSDSGVRHIIIPNTGNGRTQINNQKWDSASSISIDLPSQSGTLALTSDIAVTSINGDTGAVIVDQLKTTGSSNNTEYNLIGTTTSNANTTAVDVYKQDLLSFAKTSNNEARLTLGNSSNRGKIRLYGDPNNGSGYADFICNVENANTIELELPFQSGTIALCSDIPNVPNWALSSNKPSYTFSELTSHPTTLNDYGITNAYTKTEVDGLVSGVLHYKGTKATISALPSSGNITGDVWHITADGSEWAWDGSDWQELGTTVDLTGYLQSSDIAAWAKASTKPSYTASEVGALASNTTYVSTFNGQSGAITYTAPVTSVNGSTGAVSVTASSINAATDNHTHGSITNAGAITSNTTIASSDRLVFIDNSDSNKIKRSSITFGSSTSQYLANNGTWQNVPNTYDDTALAARVTALEQIPWVTYYTGSSTPNNSQGNNGDLYFQTAQ